MKDVVVSECCSPLKCPELSSSISEHGIHRQPSFRLITNASELFAKLTTIEAASIPGLYPTVRYEAFGTIGLLVPCFWGQRECNQHMSTGGTNLDSCQIMNRGRKTENSRIEGQIRPCAIDAILIFCATSSAASAVGSKAGNNGQSYMWRVRVPCAVRD